MDHNYVRDNGTHKCLFSCPECRMFAYRLRSRDRIVSTRRMVPGQTNHGNDRPIQSHDLFVQVPWNMWKPDLKSKEAVHPISIPTVGGRSEHLEGRLWENQAAGWRGSVLTQYCFYLGIAVLTDSNWLNLWTPLFKFLDIDDVSYNVQVLPNVKVAVEWCPGVTLKDDSQSKLKNLGVDFLLRKNPNSECHRRSCSLSIPVNFSEIQERLQIDLHRTRTCSTQSVEHTSTYAICTENLTSVR